VRAGLDPQRFSIVTVPALLAKGNPWRDYCAAEASSRRQAASWSGGSDPQAPSGAVRRGLELRNAWRDSTWGRPSKEEDRTMSELRYPNESKAYREARAALLKDEQKLNRELRSEREAAAWVTAGAKLDHAGRLSRAIMRTRIGFRTKNATMDATILSADATMNTAVQFPVAAVSTLPSGTSSAAVPLAV